MNLIVERLIELVAVGEDVRGIWADFRTSTVVHFVMEDGHEVALDVSRLNPFERNRQWKQLGQLKSVFSGVTLSEPKGA